MKMTKGLNSRVISQSEAVQLKVDGRVISRSEADKLDKKGIKEDKFVELILPADSTFFNENIKILSFLPGCNLMRDCAPLYSDERRHEIYEFYRAYIPVKYYIGIRGILEK